ncbi:MAG: YtxH domain-containing protein, partial [Prevotella sp.]
TRNKISSAVDDFCKKHDIKLNRRDADDLVENIKEAVDSEMA